MSLIYFNKKIIAAGSACISHNDRGFTLGHGLFETILVKNCMPPALDYHWKRLLKSAPVLGIPLPFSCEELEFIIQDLIIKNNLQHTRAGARVTLTHGNSERGILPAHAPSPNVLITVFECAIPVERPYSALIADTRKNEHSAAARVKSISYLDNILARHEAMQKGYDDAILLNTASNVADGSIANIYMVKKNQIVTPPVEDGALPGVVRTILLQETSYLNITEKTISLDELMMADEVFLTNALMGVQTVSKVNLVTFNCFDAANKIKEILRKKNYM